MQTIQRKKVAKWNIKFQHQYHIQKCWGGTNWASDLVGLDPRHIYDAEQINPKRWFIKLTCSSSLHPSYHSSGSYFSFLKENFDKILTTLLVNHLKFKICSGRCLK